MNDGHTVYVRRHGFLSSLVLGLCGMVSVTVVCATAVGIYGLYIIDDKIEEFVGASPDVVEALTDWQEALPPALADAIDDQRDLSYRPHVDATVELLDASSRSTTPVIEVVNRGNKVITMLSMRVTIEDDDGIPTREMTVYAATPLTIDHEWRGPLLPGSTRRFAIRSTRLGRDSAMASLEITDLRVWQGEGSFDEFDADEAGQIQLSDDTTDDETAADDEEADAEEGGEERDNEQGDGDEQANSGEQGEEDDDRDQPSESDSQAEDA